MRCKLPLRARETYLVFILHRKRPALAEDPAELRRDEPRTDNSLRGAFQKVGELYHARLVELTENYMEAKILEAAVAV